MTDLIGLKVDGLQETAELEVDRRNRELLIRVDCRRAKFKGE